MIASLLLGRSTSLLQQMHPLSSACQASSALEVVPWQSLANSLLPPCCPPHLSCSVCAGGTDTLVKPEFFHQEKNSVVENIKSEIPIGIWAEPLIRTVDKLSKTTCIWRKWTVESIQWLQSSWLHLIQISLNLVFVWIDLWQLLSQSTSAPCECTIPLSQKWMTKWHLLQ